MKLLCGAIMKLFDCLITRFTLATSRSSAVMREIESSMLVVGLLSSGLGAWHIASMEQRAERAAAASAARTLLIKRVLRPFAGDAFCVVHIVRVDISESLAKVASL